MGAGRTAPGPGRSPRRAPAGRGPPGPRLAAAPHPGRLLTGTAPLRRSGADSYAWCMTSLRHKLPRPTGARAAAFPQPPGVASRSGRRPARGAGRLVPVAVAVWCAGRAPSPRGRRRGRRALSPSAWGVLGRGWRAGPAVRVGVAGGGVPVAVSPRRPRGRGGHGAVRGARGGRRGRGRGQHEGQRAADLGRAQGGTLVVEGACRAAAGTPAHRCWCRAACRCGSSARYCPPRPPSGCRPRRRRRRCRGPAHARRW